MEIIGNMLFLYLMWIFVIINSIPVYCSQLTNNCKVSPMPDTARTSFDKLFNKFGQFFEDHDLVLGHHEIRKVLLELGIFMSVDERMPLLAYLVKYRKFLDDKNSAAITALELKYTKKYNDLQRRMEEVEIRRSKRLNKEVTEFKQFLSDRAHIFTC